ncbi:thioredoxin domain-containing protein [Streptomyces sp. SID8379]|uniref:DsbA family protein n=1 Tax=unclassified Streptomyces TaxID=2593676 RepID=UPI0003645ADD|nr:MULTISPECIES: thioredoxin domain-containing protein [unclassified Streptomyces]MYW63300.1 thioredoxin domain-containing protein [Streptomyces sp. SID8379]
MPENTTPSKARPLAIVAAVAVAAAVLGTVSYTATKPEPRTDASRQEAASGQQLDDATAQLVELARRDGRDPLAQGRADAPVVLIEYADFRCGYCGQFARDTEPGLVKKYVDEGTLRIEWRNFPIFGAESEAAARASWAAGQQGRFWQFHRAAYTDGAKEQGFGAGRLDALAREAGVKDLDRFRTDRDSQEARAAVKKDQDEAYRLGATSTPSFLINGQPLAGAQPAATFEQAVEAAKAQAAK